MKKLVTLSALVFMIGCLKNEVSAQVVGNVSVEVQIQKVVQAGLKDPDSAKFGPLKFIDEENACLTVNAKNAMGGYTGNQQAFVKKIDGVWFLLTIEAISQDVCVLVVKRTMKK